MPEGLTFAIAAVLSISAPLTGWIAFRRDRPPIAWFVFGALSGPLALAILLVAPPGHCPRCDTTVPGWPVSCATCGWRFAGASAAARLLRPAAPAPEVPGRVAEPDLPPAVGRTTRRADASRRRAPEARVFDVAADPPAPGPLPGRMVERPPASPEPTGLWPRLVAQAANEARPSGTDHEASRAAGQATGADGAGDGGLQMVASGIFTGGSVRLEIGLRYGICRDGPNLVILGPVDRTPGQVQAVLPIEEIDLLSIGDRVTVARAGVQDRLALAFISAAGLRGKALEEALADVTARHVDVAGPTPR